MSGNLRSSEWVNRTARYVADWRAEAAEVYGRRLGTIIISGNCMESIDYPMRIEREHHNDNGRAGQPLPNCPLCGSFAVGHHVTRGTFQCHSCGHEWRGQ